MFSSFFIDRPIFASVLSILITLAGSVAAVQLPIAQFPPVAPPTVQVDCNYPGASAEVVAQSVAAPIEQQVNGVEDMMYMASQSTSDGSYTLTVTFKPGTNLNVSQVLVQNRVSLALPQLPDVVRQTGVTVKKRSPDILLTVSLSSPNGRYDQLYLSNYAVLHLKDELARLPGISEVLVFGQRDYSMRAWLDPDLLAERQLTVGDVTAALAEQNFQVALGQVGQPPNTGPQPTQVPLHVVGRLRTPEEFGQIVLRALPDGRILRLANVARVELGARSQDVAMRFDGKPTVGLAIFQLPTANALDTADSVKAKVAELARDFPDDMGYDIGLDTTPYIRQSIEEVYHSLRDSILLVAVVVLVFLQGWRPAIIPLVAVPVAIIGTFAAMAAVGFSLNNLTLFGLVLAIGIVVDDAIVVVEAVQHHIDRGLAPRAAAAQAMEEVSGPIIAVGLVLTAVFVPCMFVSGIVGMFFRQFAVTIAVSTLISMVNSLTLSPALASLLLTPHARKPDFVTRILNFLFGWLFRGFERAFQGFTHGYLFCVGRLLRLPLIVGLVYAGLMGLTYWSYARLPKGFIPSQDKGYLLGSIQLPDAASAERTREVMTRMEELIRTVPGVAHTNGVAGNSFTLSAYGSNFGSIFIILKDFSERLRPGLYSEDIAATIRKRLSSEFPEALALVFSAPAVSGLGRAGGFRFMVEDHGEVGLSGLQTYTDLLVEKGGKDTRLQNVSTIYKANSPTLFVNLDRKACQTAGVQLGDVFATLQGFLGSRYVNDFNRFGRTWQLVVQADATFRDQIEDLKRLKVRNSQGKMLALGAIAEVKRVSSPLVLTRYNMYPAAALMGSVANGVSSGQGIQTLEAIADRELPSSMAYEWTELTYLERLSADTGMAVFGMSVTFVFLVLAALYESWTLPLAVILVVPMCVLSASAGVSYNNLEVNVFTQIGMVVLIGLACKNAILIVEFAKYRRETGSDAKTSALAACELRIRPIMMTSFAFILGVVPLIAAQGAGAEMRKALGVAVFYGMLGVTLFGILLAPVFFYVLDRIFPVEKSLAESVLDWIARGRQFLGKRIALRRRPKIGAPT
jgi:multidrug efflux pump